MNNNSFPETIPFIDITEELRQEALEIAKGRRQRAIDNSRPSKFPLTSNQSSFVDVDWQGLIGELALVKEFPLLDDSQIRSTQLRLPDIHFGEYFLEVKCSHTPKLYPAYLINKIAYHNDIYSKCKYIICTGIPCSPDKTDRLYLFGWVERSRVLKYPADNYVPNPAYAVDMNDLLKNKMSSLCSLIGYPLKKEEKAAPIKLGAFM